MYILYHHCFTRAHLKEIVSFFKIHYSTQAEHSYAPAYQDDYRILIEKLSISDGLPSDPATIEEELRKLIASWELQKKSDEELSSDRDVQEYLNRWFLKLNESHDFLEQAEPSDIEVDELSSEESAGDDEDEDDSDEDEIFKKRKEVIASPIAERQKTIEDLGFSADDRIIKLPYLYTNPPKSGGKNFDFTRLTVFVLRLRQDGTLLAALLGRQKEKKDYFWAPIKLYTQVRGARKPKNPFPLDEWTDQLADGTWKVKPTIDIEKQSLSYMQKQKAEADSQNSRMKEILIPVKFFDWNNLIPVAYNPYSCSFVGEIFQEGNLLGYSIKPDIWVSVPGVARSEDLRAQWNVRAIYFEGKLLKKAVLKTRFNQEDLYASVNFAQEKLGKKFGDIEAKSKFQSINILGYLEITPAGIAEKEERVLVEAINQTTGQINFPSHLFNWKTLKMLDKRPEVEEAIAADDEIPADQVHIAQEPENLPEEDLKEVSIPGHVRIAIPKREKDKDKYIGIASVKVVALQLDSQNRLVAAETCVEGKNPRTFIVPCCQTGVTIPKGYQASIKQNETGALIIDEEKFLEILNKKLASYRKETSVQLPNSFFDFSSPQLKIAHKVKKQGRKRPPDLLLDGEVGQEEEDLHPPLPRKRNCPGKASAVGIFGVKVTEKPPALLAAATP